MLNRRNRGSKLPIRSLVGPASSISSSDGSGSEGGGAPLYSPAMKVSTVAPVEDDGQAKTEDVSPPANAHPSQLKVANDAGAVRASGPSPVNGSKLNPSTKPFVMPSTLSYAAESKVQQQPYVVPAANGYAAESKVQQQPFAMPSANGHTAEPKNQQQAFATPSTTGRVAEPKAQQQPFATPSSNGHAARGEAKTKHRSSVASSPHDEMLLNMLKENIAKTAASTPQQPPRQNGRMYGNEQNRHHKRFTQSSSATTFFYPQMHHDLSQTSWSRAVNNFTSPGGVSAPDSHSQERTEFDHQEQNAVRADPYSNGQKSDVQSQMQRNGRANSYIDGPQAQRHYLQNTGTADSYANGQQAEQAYQGNNARVDSYAEGQHAGLLRQQNNGMADTYANGQQAGLHHQQNNGRVDSYAEDQQARLHHQQKDAGAHPYMYADGQQTGFHQQLQNAGPHPYMYTSGQQAGLQHQQQNVGAHPYMYADGQQTGFHRRAQSNARVEPQHAYQQNPSQASDGSPMSRGSANAGQSRGQQTGPRQHRGLPPAQNRHVVNVGGRRASPTWPLAYANSPGPSFKAPEEENHWTFKMPPPVTEPLQLGPRLLPEPLFAPPSEMTKRARSDMLNALVGDSGMPKLNDLMSPHFFPFEEPAAQRAIRRSTGVVRLKNIPYVSTRGEIISFLGRNSRILNDIDEPVHVIMDRVNSKTNDAYVEFMTDQDAINAVNRHKTNVAKGRARLGTRPIEIEVVGHGTFMEDLFSICHGVDWHGPMPRIKPYNPAEPWNNFKTFVTEEEMTLLVKHVEVPTRSPFSRDCPERAFECLISTIKKMPWHMTEHITIKQRHSVYDASVKLLGHLTDAIQREKHVDRMTPQLRSRLVNAVMRCPGFTVLQKDNIAHMVPMDATEWKKYNMPLYPDLWVHLYALGPRPGVPSDVLEYYIRIIREETIRAYDELSIREKQELAELGRSTSDHWGYLWREIGYPFGPEFDNMTLAEAATLEWAAMDRILRRALDVANGGTGEKFLSPPFKNPFKHNEANRSAVVLYQSDGSSDASGNDGNFNGGGMNYGPNPMNMGNGHGGGHFYAPNDMNPNGNHAGYGFNAPSAPMMAHGINTDAMSYHSSGSDCDTVIHDGGRW